jgi:predicted transposase/invertase (TIGR01784 family)
MLATNLKKWEQELIQQGIYKGKEEGKQEGFFEGAKYKALVTARKLKQKGMPAQDIAEVTGLSVEEVEKL